MNNPNACLSIVAYKPKPGKETELLALSREHVPYLRSIGLVTERPHILASASDGTIIEVFEWVAGGIEKAHHHEGLKPLWARYNEACEYVPLKTLEEAGMMFANFTPIH
jgi:hypothetical protein